MHVAMEVAVARGQQWRVRTAHPSMHEAMVEAGVRGQLPHNMKGKTKHEAMVEARVRGQSPHNLHGKHQTMHVAMEAAVARGQPWGGRAARPSMQVAMVAAGGCHPCPMPKQRQS